jgi:hypothetical protein
MPSNPNLKSNAGTELATGKIVRFPKSPEQYTYEKIRPELNLEKWAIWQPAHSKNKETRTFTRRIKNGDGTETVQQVTVHYVDKVGTLTTEDQKTYYALVKHWEDKGRSSEWTFFSLRQLAKLLRKKWGTNVIESLTQSLTRLRTIGIVWTNAYYDGKMETTKDELDPFTILSKVKIVRRKTHGHVTTAVGYFKFEDDILQNLMANYTKPLILDTVLSFNSEIAQVLYTYLDLILADKTFFERRTKELFTELGLAGTAYIKAGKRKQVLEPALKELCGVLLSTGRIASATLEKTKDEKDYKIVIRKGKLVALPKINHYEDEKPEPLPETAVPLELEQSFEPLVVKQIVKDDLQRQAEGLVAHFYHAFHGGKNFQVTSKAAGQAVSLITQFGFERSKGIVDYAKREAPKTHFEIQTFGGVMQYTSRALDDYERQRLAKERAAETRRHQEEQARREAEEDRSREEKKVRAKAYLDSLPREEYETLFTNYAKEQRHRFGYLNRIPEESANSQIERMLIREVVKQLESEPSSQQSPETQKMAQGESKTAETILDSTPERIAH